MAFAFTVLADVEAILGRPLTDTVRVDRLIALASARVADVMGYDALTAPAPNPPPSVVVTITANMVVRVLANPTGVQSQTAGPFSETYGAAEPGLTITDAELALLRAWRANHKQLYAIRTTRGIDNLTQWVPTDVGGDLVPFESLYEGGWF